MSAPAPAIPLDMAVETRGLVKAFGPVPAVCEVDLAVDRGELLAVLGPSG